MICLLQLILGKLRFKSIETYGCHKLADVEMPLQEKRSPRLKHYDCVRALLVPPRTSKRVAQTGPFAVQRMVHKVASKDIVTNKPLYLFV